MKVFRRLGGRILATFAALLLLLSLTYGVLAAHFGREMVIHSSSNEMRVLAIILSQLIQKQFSSLEDYLENIQSNDVVTRSLEYGNRDPLALATYLYEQRSRYSIFEDLMIYNLDGHCIGATDPDWFKIGGNSYAFFKNGLEEFNFPTIYGTDSAGKVQLVSAPIVNSQHAVIGVIVAIIRLNAVYDLMSQKIGLNENRDAFLLDEDLRFITPGKDGPEELVESHLASTALKEHLRDDSWVGEYLNYEGVKVLGTALKIPGYSWYVVVERRYDGVVQQVSAIQKVIFWVSAGLLVIFVVVSLLISRSVTQPLLRLVQSTRAIGAGNLNERIETTSQIEEVEFLAIEFERMRQRVAQTQDRLKERLEESEAARVESERLAAIGTLASSLAHEIRNPLNAMSLLLSRLQSKVQTDTGAEIVRDVFGEVARLDRLVKSILDYSRPVFLDRKNIELNALLQSCVEFYDALFIQKSVQCSIDLWPLDRPAIIWGDEDKLKQCLINAFQNAMEAMDGEGKLLVSCKPLDNSEIIVIDVVDTGAGISEEIRGKLFSPFFTTKVSGNGLGLSNIQKIVSAHGGRVEILRADSLGYGLPWRTALRLHLPPSTNHNQ